MVKIITTLPINIKDGGILLIFIITITASEVFFLMLNLFIFMFSIKFMVIIKEIE